MSEVEKVCLTQERYAVLLQKEERLELLERAIQETNSYDLSAIKSIFGLHKEN